MLNEVKHLRARRERPFAEFTLERSEGLRVTDITASLGYRPERQRCGVTISIAGTTGVQVIPLHQPQVVSLSSLPLKRLPGEVSIRLLTTSPETAFSQTMLLHPLHLLLLPPGEVLGPENTFLHSEGLCSDKYTCMSFENFPLTGVTRVKRAQVIPGRSKLVRHQKKRNP